MGTVLSFEQYVPAHCGAQAHRPSAVHCPLRLQSSSVAHLQGCRVRSARALAAPAPLADEAEAEACASTPRQAHATASIPPLGGSPFLGSITELGIFFFFVIIILPTLHDLVDVSHNPLW